MGTTVSARTVLGPIGRPLRRAVVGARTRGWNDYTRLFVEYDASGWVLEYEATQLEKIARDLGVALGPRGWAGAISGQSVFHLSQFDLLLGGFERRGNRIGLSYFHGRPGTPGMPEFDECFSVLRRQHADIHRVQVTNAAMEELLLETGIAAEKLHRIPIGIDPDAFPLRTAAGRAAARTALGVPLSAFVVGSFQKDGVGWKDGLEPKLIKGPDILLETLAYLRDLLPELFVLVTGPARGYVRSGLERLQIPYRHVLLPDIDSVASSYDAVDVCLVTSRDEGGPRAVLESLATGVPLVSTRVGQAADLVSSGQTGWLVDVDDVDGLVAATVRVAELTSSELEAVRRRGRVTAEANSYVALRPRWRDLLRGFVELRRG